VTNEVGAAGPDGIGFDLAGDFTSQKFNLIGMAEAAWDLLMESMRTMSAALPTPSIHDWARSK
jgi:hypothetical protein